MTLRCVSLWLSMLCIASVIALLLCTASVSQYSFRDRFGLEGSQTGLYPKQVNQTMTKRNKGYYAALQAV